MLTTHHVSEPQRPPDVSFLPRHTSTKHKQTVSQLHLGACDKVPLISSDCGPKECLSAPAHAAGRAVRWGFGIR